MAKRPQARPAARKPAKRRKTQPDYELLEARRAARRQREFVKLTRRFRRDLATHRRELRMLLLDLDHYLNTVDGRRDDERSDESAAAPNAGALADDEGPAVVVA